LVVGVFTAIGAATGSLEYLANSQTEGASVRFVDVALLGFMLLGISFVVIFFNAALIAAAIERLRGGDPTVASGLRAVVPHIHNIFGWAVISASVGLVLRAL